MLTLTVPVPEQRRGFRQQHQRGLTQCGGKMRGGVANRDDDVTGIDQCCEIIDILEVIDVIKFLQTNTGICFERLSLVSGISILEINKIKAGQAQGL